MSTMSVREKQLLQQDIPIFKREIQMLYKKFDAKFKLKGAQVPIKFTFDESILGSYTPPLQGKKECFTFSLYFIGYCSKDSMHRLDKIDLFAHEYAHYMQYNYEIPQEHCWKQGKHGSAWKYCCSLVGAAPTEYYRIGEGLKKHNYEKALYNPFADKHYDLKAKVRQRKEEAIHRGGQVRFSKGEEIRHPRYGTGVIEEIEALSGCVRLHVRFGEMIKQIDQAWLLKNGGKL